MSAIKDLPDIDFELFRKLIYEKSGISLNKTKKELLRTRLRSRLEKQGFTSYKNYYKHVLNDGTGQALIDLLDDISTNLTSFYREVNHFNFLNELLPNWIAKKQKAGDTEFRVWSAGCSTGEEPYTLAFTLLKHLADKQRTWNIKILATDISTEVLRKAAAGVYEAERLKDVPDFAKKNYFTKEKSVGKKPLVRVLPEVRNLITFSRFNLMTASYPFKKMFDFIFCRNVMIYFDRPTQEKLVGKFYNQTAPEGYLFIGHSESLTGLKQSYSYVQPTVYQK